MKKNIRDHRNIILVILTLLGSNQTVCAAQSPDPINAHIEACRRYLNETETTLTQIKNAHMENDIVQVGQHQLTLEKCFVNHILDIQSHLDRLNPPPVLPPYLTINKIDDLLKLYKRFHVIEEDIRNLAQELIWNLNNINDCLRKVNAPITPSDNDRTAHISTITAHLQAYAPPLVPIELERARREAQRMRERAQVAGGIDTRTGAGTIHFLAMTPTPSQFNRAINAEYRAERQFMDESIAQREQTPLWKECRKALIEELGEAMQLYQLIYKAPHPHWGEVFE